MMRIATLMSIVVSISIVLVGSGLTGNHASAEMLDAPTLHSLSNTQKSTLRTFWAHVHQDKQHLDRLLDKISVNNPLTVEQENSVFVAVHNEANRDEKRLGKFNVPDSLPLLFGLWMNRSMLATELSYKSYEDYSSLARLYLTDGKTSTLNQATASFRDALNQWNDAERYIDQILMFTKAAS